MAASNYSVNIKLNTKPARVQLEALERRVNKLRASLNTPLRIESKATLIKKQQVALEDKKFSMMHRTRRLGDQIRKLEERGLKLDKLKLEILNAARNTEKGRFQTAKDSQKFVADELKTIEKQLEAKVKNAGIDKQKLRDLNLIIGKKRVELSLIRTAGKFADFNARQRKGIGPNNLLGLPSTEMLKPEKRGIKILDLGTQGRQQTSTPFGPEIATANQLKKFGVGPVAMDIDTKLAQQRKRIKFNHELNMLELKGVKTTKLRAKMGELVDAQNRKQFGSIKRINNELQNGITKLKNQLKLINQANKKQNQIAKGRFAKGSNFGKIGGSIGPALPQSMKGGKFGLQSALISGAFPLLFGQGPLIGAAGFLGGGFGEKFGGQMGGFAGGLVATAVAQSLASITNSINEFGSALNDPAKNLDKLVERIGKFDKEVVESISQLKNAGLDQVAGELASLTMQQEFKGLDSVKNLNNEMTKFQKGVANLGTRISILVAGPLTLLFKALNLIGRNADKAVKDLTSTDKIRKQQEKLDTDLAKEESLLESIRENKTELLKIPKFQQAGNTAATLRLNISLQEKALQKTRESIRDNSRLLEIRKLQREVLLSEGRLLKGQIELERLKANVTRGTEDEKAVALKQKQIDMQKVENKLLKERANLKSLLNNTKATKAEKEAQEEKIKNLEREFKLVQIIANERINAADPAISRIDELNRKMRDLNDLVKQSVELSKVIGESFADSFKGVIKGTMSVQEAFRNMLNRIADYFLDVAAQMAATALQRSLLGLLGGIFNFSTTPLNDIQNPNTRLAANGGPVGMKNPYIVGERGPELFVPNQSGNIIPNHDLAGIGGGGTNIVVNVDASGSSVEGDEAQAEQLGQAISQAIQAELIQQQRPGGLLYS